MAWSGFRRLVPVWLPAAGRQGDRGMGGQGDRGMGGQGDRGMGGKGDRGMGGKGAAGGAGNTQIKMNRRDLANRSWQMDDSHGLAIHYTT